ncbi:TPA: HAMP domain-containing protein [Candidatus Poribacteria bacterium]|nr:HAMP domain-containing protein [Candidatus Poribacteria bacterium]
MIFQNHRLSTLSLKTKLILIFAFLSFMPTILMMLFSYFIIAQGISKWEELTNELRKLRVLPMIEGARTVSLETNVIQALEKKIQLSSLDLALPEGYIVAIYDDKGNMLFNSTTDPLLQNKFANFDDLGLPPVELFPRNEPVLPKEPIKLKDKELALAGMTIYSDNGSLLGIAVVGKVVPLAPTDLSNMRRGIAVILLFAAVVIFLIALWISSLIAKEITEPIRILVKGTREVADGNLLHKVDIDARDEVGMLAESFNIMTDKLNKYAEDLRRAEKSAAWKEVAQKFAHEIKNPLTPIQLSAERIRKRYYTKPEEYDEILNEGTNIIIEEVERLRLLLDEFMQYARMPLLAPTLTDVNEVIANALKSYGEIPENIDIITNYSDNIPKVMIDPEQTRRAFFNIIKNAIEAIEKEGKIEITTRLIDDQNQQKWVEIEFSDTGVGIPPETMNNLFTPHFSTKRGGAGLGLTIVKKIIDDQGGTIEVSSEQNKGTTFWIRLPVSEGEDLK